MGEKNGEDSTREKYILIRLEKAAVPVKSVNYQQQELQALRIPAHTSTRG